MKSVADPVVRLFPACQSCEVMVRNEKELQPNRESLVTLHLSKNQSFKNPETNNWLEISREEEEEVLTTVRPYKSG